MSINVYRPASWSVSSSAFAATSVRCAVPVLALVVSTACGETQTGGGDHSMSDATGSSTNLSGSATSSNSSAGASSVVTSSNVGTSGSSGATTTQGASGSSSSSTTTGASGSRTEPGLSSGTAATTGEATTTTDVTAAASTDGDAGATTADATTSDDGSGSPDDGSMSFFVSSVGHTNGGNLGGLDGADALCAELAAAVSESLGNKTWRAYLSTNTVNARDRIGNGPWRNADGAIIADNIDDLHAQEEGEALDSTWPPAELSVALTENGGEVPNSIHDILTGSLPDGSVDADRHCNDWTSSETTDEASVGHSNRDGGGRPPYFNATHQVGCAPSAANYEDGTVTSGGGQGSIYCFALTSSE
jgi:hypothetical protein